MQHRWRHALFPAMKLASFVLALTVTTIAIAEDKNVGVGAKPVEGAEVVLDGSRAMLDGLR